MMIEREISDYESELAALKQALNLTDSKDEERRIRIAEQIAEIEEIIEDLTEEKNKSDQYRD